MPGRSVTKSPCLISVSIKLIDTVMEPSIHNAKIHAFRRHDCLYMFRMSSVTSVHAIRSTGRSTWGNSISVVVLVCAKLRFFVEMRKSSIFVL